MVHLQGEQAFSLAREELWAKLTNLNFLVKCIPDVHEVREVKDKTASLVVRPGFSFVRGQLQLDIEKLEESRPDSARMLFQNKGIGTSAEVEASFQLEERDGETVIRWTGDLKHLGGLLKAVPRGLIQAASQKVVNDLMTRLKEQLEA